MIRKFSLFLSVIIVFMIITACSSGEKEEAASEEQPVNSGAEKDSVSEENESETESSDIPSEAEESKVDEETQNGTSDEQVSNENAGTSTPEAEQENIAQDGTITGLDLINHIGETLHFGYTPDQLKGEFGEPDSIRTELANMMFYYEDAVYTISSETNAVHIVSVLEGKASTFFKDMNEVRSTYSESGNWEMSEEIYDEEYHLIVQNSEYYLVFVSDQSATKLKAFWVQKV